MEKVILHLHRCKACGRCIEECPKGAVSRSGKTNKKGYEVVEVDQELCVACATCYTVCPDYVFEICSGKEP